MKLSEAVLSGKFHRPLPRIEAISRTVGGRGLAERRGGSIPAGGALGERALLPRSSGRAQRQEGAPAVWGEDPTRSRRGGTVESSGVETEAINELRETDL